MKATYLKESHQIQEQPEMKEPNVLDYDYLEYIKLIDEYQDHVASCKEYNVGVSKEKVKWVDGQILEEGKDFKIAFEKSRTESTGGNLYNEISSAETIKYFAMPIEENKKVEEGENNS